MSLADKVAWAEGILNSIAVEVADASAGKKLDENELLRQRKELYSIPIYIADLRVFGLEPLIDLRLKSDVSRRQLIEESIKTTFFSFLLLGSESWPNKTLNHMENGGSSSLKTYFTYPAPGAGEYIAKKDHIEYSIQTMSDELLANVSLATSYITLDGEPIQEILSGATSLQVQVSGPWGPGIAVGLHEYGHALALSPRSKLFKDNRLPINYEWQQAFELSQLPSRYAARNCHEAFAEAVSAFYVDPVFKCYAPAEFAFLKSILSANEKIYGEKTPYSQIDCTKPALVKAIELRKQEVPLRQPKLHCG